MMPIKIVSFLGILYLLYRSNIKTEFFVGIILLCLILIFSNEAKEGFEMIRPNSKFSNLVIKGYEDCITGKCFETKNIANNKTYVNNDVIRELTKLLQFNMTPEIKKKIEDKINELNENNQFLEAKLDVIPSNYHYSPKDGRVIYNYTIEQLDFIETILKLLKHSNPNNDELQDIQKINEAKKYNVNDFFINNPDKLLPKSYDNGMTTSFEEIGRNLKDIKETSLDPNKIDGVVRNLVKFLNKVSDDWSIGRAPADAINFDIVPDDLVNPYISQEYFSRKF